MCSEYTFMRYLHVSFFFQRDIWLKAIPHRLVLINSVTLSAECVCVCMCAEFDCKVFSLNQFIQFISQFAIAFIKHGSMHFWINRNLSFTSFMLKIPHTVIIQNTSSVFCVYRHQCNVDMPVMVQVWSVSNSLSIPLFHHLSLYVSIDLYIESDGWMFCRMLGKMHKLYNWMIHNAE